MITKVQNLIAAKPRLWAWGTMGTVVIVALSIRLIGLGAESAWIDEAYSITLSHLPAIQIIQGTAADQHPPLYYLLLHLWMLFGDKISYVRLLSALLGTINVVQVMVFGRKVGGELLGIGAALLLAISPFHVWYSQEARQYILLAVLTTAATVELWNCLHGKRRWILYCLFCLLAIYTQYFAVFIFLAHAALVILWSFHQKHKRLLLPWATSMIVVGLAFAPWLPTAINQFLYHTMPWISEPGAGDVRDLALRLLLGGGVVWLPLSVRWACLVALLGGLVWVTYKYILHKPEIRWNFGFISLWTLIPFVSISVVAIFYPVFQFKQFLIILVPLMLAVTVIAIVIPRPWGSLFFAGIALVSGLTMIYQQSILTKDDWRGVAYYIESRAENGDLVYGNPAASSLALDLYWENTFPYTGYPINYNILRGGWAGQPLTAQLVDEQLSESTSGFKRVWLVEFFPEYWDKHEYISSWLASHGTILADRSFGSIRLRLYELTP
jgi:mannosyltransferase